MKKIEIKNFNQDYLKATWSKGFTDDAPEWSKWNGPYFKDYYKIDTFEEFLKDDMVKFLLSENAMCILVDDEPVGMLSRTWIDKKTLWLEIGIVIYDENYWHGGVGTQALRDWTSKTFDDIPEIEHIGMTTWSGNARMMRVAEKLGYTKEGQIRKVRYWQGVFYDSVKYGVLRDEWFASED